MADLNDLLSQQTLANLTPEQKDALLLQLLQMVGSSSVNQDEKKADGVSDDSTVTSDNSESDMFEEDGNDDDHIDDGFVSDSSDSSGGSSGSGSNVSGVLSLAGQPIEMIDTIDDAFQDAFDNFVASHPNGLPSPKECRGEIMKLMKDECELHNSILPRNKNGGIIRDPANPPFTMPKALPPDIIAQCMVQRGDVVNMQTSFKKNDEASDTLNNTLLAYYIDSGDDKGLWHYMEAGPRDKGFVAKVKEYSRFIDKKEIDLVYTCLSGYAPTAIPFMDENYTACKNGVWDFRSNKNGQTNPVTGKPYNYKPFYTWEEVRAKGWKFIWKLNVNYNPNAKNNVIHNPEDGLDWDVETGFGAFFDGDSDRTNGLWEVLHSCIRPYVAYNTGIWLTEPSGSSGNNGKSTILEVVLSLLGESHCISIAMSKMSDKFALAPLTHSIAILCDDNSSSEYVVDASIYKSLATGGTVGIEPKFGEAFNYTWYGRMIFCQNRYPHFKENTGAIDRRVYIIDFNRSFEGIERKYIKEDYLHRTDVLEYILFKLLHMDVREFTKYDYVLQNRRSFREQTDPITAFLNDVMGKMSWDFIPFTYLKDLFHAWYKREFNSEITYSQENFIRAVVKWTKIQERENHGDWHAELNADDSIKKIYVTKAMVEQMSTVPLAITSEYEQYGNHMYRWINTTKIRGEGRYIPPYPPAVKSRMTGIRRMDALGASNIDVVSEEVED